MRVGIFNKREETVGALNATMRGLALTLYRNVKMLKSLASSMVIKD